MTAGKTSMGSGSFLTNVYQLLVSKKKINNFNLSVDLDMLYNTKLP